MKLRLFVAAGAALLTLAACGGVQPTPTADTVVEDGVREIEVEASRFKFIPSSISVTQGERVRLKVRSTDISHTFTIDELEVDLSLPGGGAAPWAVKELVVQMPGTYLLYCRPHRDRAHVATFEVIPSGATEGQTPAPP